MMFVFFSIHLYLLATYLIDDFFKSGDLCYDYYKKYDVAVYVANVTDDSIIEEMSKVKGTSEIETAHISYGYVKTKEGKLDTEVRTITKKFALPLEFEGKLPENSNEVALLKHWAKAYDVKIGDVITVEEDEYLQDEELIVTALFESSQFLRKMPFTYGISKITGNMISCEIFVNKNALNSNYVDDNYIMMKNNSFRGLSKFSKEYKNSCEKYIERIENRLDLLIDKNYYIEKWDEELGYILAETFSGIIKVVYEILVPILFLIAIMVLITTISRMIIEQKNDIGNMKANGFTNREISMIYYIYSTTSAIIGIILANVVATFFTERFVMKYIASVIAFKSESFMYDIRRISFTIFIPMAIIIFATHMCIKKILKKEIIEILNKKKTFATKTYSYEYLTIFKKIPIFIQMIINNALKDTKRCVGIILGIIGSVLLLVSGITITKNAYDGYNYQINNDICFDKIVFFNPASEAKNEIEKVLKDYNINYALCQYANLVLRNPKNKTNGFVLFVYDNKEDFSKLFRINTMSNENPNYNGLFIQESYKKYYNLKEKGYVKIRDLKGNFKNKRVSKYFYNYVESTAWAMIDKETYEDLFDTKSYMQAYIVDKNFQDFMHNKLLDIDGYLYCMDYKKDLTNGFYVQYNFLNILVGIFILTSIMLSFFIVLNFMKINIIERKTEFITLIINGFTIKEIRNYVLLDLIIMILVSNVFGIILGSIVGRIVLRSFTRDVLLFMNRTSYSAIFISIIINVIIYSIITRLSIKEIDKMDISDINK